MANQVDKFIARYSAGMATAIKGCRRRMRKLFPRGYELVYDNYNALVFAYAPSAGTSQAFISIAAYPRWVTLFFRDGTSLEDPKSLLEGSGSQYRSIRLASAADLDKPAVLALIRQARKPHASLLAKAPLRTTLVKGIAAKQRKRR